MIPSPTLFLTKLLLLLSLPSLIPSQQHEQQHQCADDASNGDGTCASPQDIKQQRRRRIPHADADDPVEPVEPVEPPCKNDHPNCSDWANQGECIANPKYMLLHCTKSCGHCSTSRPGPGVATVTFDDDHQRTLRLPDDFVDPCQDENPDCSKWSKEGECVNNPTFMLVSCARSCGSCTTKSSTAKEGGDGEEEKKEENSQMVGVTCADEYESCEEWAKGAECWVNPLCEYLSVLYASGVLSTFYADLVLYASGMQLPQQFNAPIRRLDLYTMVRYRSRLLSAGFCSNIFDIGLWSSTFDSRGGGRRAASPNCSIGIMVYVWIPRCSPKRRRRQLHRA